MPLQFTTTGAVAVALSNGNKTATSTAAGGFGAGAYLNEVVAGKCCFAMRFNGPADGGNIVELVAAPTGLDFASYNISGTYISEFTNAGLANSNGSPTGATLSGLAPIVDGDVLFVCIDEPNNLIWVYKNGTIVSGAGNPAAGTGGLSGYLISGARNPGVALSNTGAAVTVIDDPVAAGITVPSGFTYLGYSTPPTNPPSNTSLPTISPTAAFVGQQIVANVGSFSNSPTSYGVQFYLDGAPVGSRSSTLTYTPVAADAGKKPSIGVIATNAIGDSAEAFSAEGSPIKHTWQLVGVAVSAINTSGNYTLTLPSGSQSGDVVVAAIAMRSNVGFTVPAGWSLANQDTGGNTTNGTTASDTSSMQAYIIRGGSAPSMVFTRSGGSRALGVVAVYRYTDQSAPPTFDTSVLTPLGTAATGISGTGLTTGAAGELIVGAVFGARNITVSNFRATDPATGSGATDTTSNPADGAWTERADSLNATSPTVGIFLADAVRTTAGATGNLLATASASALHAIGAMAFAVPAANGPQTLTGTLFADGDSFGAGSIQPGPVSLTGTLFSSTNSFGAGSVSATYSIAGTLFSEADSFGTGSLLVGPVTMTGTQFSDPDSFGAGSVNQAGGVQTVVGTLFNDGDTFGSGIVSPGGVTLAGTLFSDADAFGVGALSVGPVTIGGTLCQDADQFGSGAVLRGGITIYGVLLSNPDSFGAGVVTQEGGPQYVIGAPFIDADSFGQGAVVTAGTPVEPEVQYGGGGWVGPDRREEEYRRKAEDRARLRATIRKAMRDQAGKPDEVVQAADAVQAIVAPAVVGNRQRIDWAALSGQLNELMQAAAIYSEVLAAAEVQSAARAMAEADDEDVAIALLLAA